MFLKIKCFEDNEQRVVVIENTSFKSIHFKEEFIIGANLHPQKHSSAQHCHQKAFSVLSVVLNALLKDLGLQSPRRRCCLGSSRCFVCFCLILRLSKACTESCSPLLGLDLSQAQVLFLERPGLSEIPKPGGSGQLGPALLLPVPVRPWHCSS